MSCDATDKTHPPVCGAWEDVHPGNGRMQGDMYARRRSKDKTHGCKKRTHEQETSTQGGETRTQREDAIKERSEIKQLNEKRSFKSNIHQNRKLNRICLL